VKVYVDYLEVWYAQRKVERIPRLRGEDKYRINYRHIIDWLVRKPGAFENYRYKTEVFPSSYFRMAYDCLKHQNPLRANKEYTAMLYLAAKDSESLIEAAIRYCLSKEKPLSAKRIKDIIEKENKLPPVTEVAIDDVSLEAYDQLLGACKEVVANG
ncbi:MAG: IS21 family transposase, partial [Elusimicrobiota bacterium]|nr:IS21 family transposase [Elusimicrobiota bacterium]